MFFGRLFHIHSRYWCEAERLILTFNSKQFLIRHNLTIMHITEAHLSYKSDKFWQSCIHPHCHMFVENLIFLSLKAWKFFTFIPRVVLDKLTAKAFHLTIWPNSSTTSLTITYRMTCLFFYSKNFFLRFWNKISFVTVNYDVWILIFLKTGSSKPSPTVCLPRCIAFVVEKEPNFQ